MYNTELIIQSVHKLFSLKPIVYVSCSLDLSYWIRLRAFGRFVQTDAGPKLHTAWRRALISMLEHSHWMAMHWTTRIHWVGVFLALEVPWDIARPRRLFLMMSLKTYLRSLLAWISNCIPSKVWDEFTYPFPNFNGATVEVWEWISNFVPRVIIGVINYSCWD